MARTSGSAVADTRRAGGAEITTAGELRAVVGAASGLSRRQRLTELDPYCRAFIAHSPFVVVASSGGDGRCDVSVRGDHPGFVRTPTSRILLMPERMGNRMVDTLANTLENPFLGMLFIVPGVEETVRVNGRAAIVRDEEILRACAANGRPAMLAVVITVEEAFLHCPKSFRRSRLWDTSSWADRSALASIDEILRAHVCEAGAPADEVERWIQGAKELGPSD